MSDADHNADPALLEEMDAIDAGWAARAADILLSGQNALLPGWTQRRHRLLQKRMAWGRSRRGDRPDFLVLGSSRQGFTRPLSQKAKGVNLWINSAMMGDRPFTARLAEKTFGIPDVVMVGADPWMFDPRAGRMAEFTRWSLPVFAEEYAEAVAGYPGMGAGEFHEQWGEPLSPGAAARLAIPSFGDDPAFRRLPSPIDGEEHEEFIVAFPDGSFEHRLGYRDRPVDEVWVEAARWGAEYAWYMRNTFPEPDPFLWRVFTGFFTRLIEGGRKVIIYLPPFHPAAYHSYRLAAARMERPLLERLEADIGDFAGKLGITVTGSFDPTHYSAAAEDFVDGWHARRSSMPKFFGTLIDDCLFHS
jgi:hypothetical protein